MYRLFRPLHKLQWQLSLSYLLVVVIAIPILFGAGLALVALTPSPTPAQQLEQVLSRNVAPLVPHPIDSQNAAARARLNAWAFNFVLNQHPVKAETSQQVPQLNASETLALAIINNSGRMAGSYPALPSNNAAIDPSSLAFFLQKARINVPVSQQVIRAAFANQQDLATLVNTLPDGQTLAAVPLSDAQQNVNGVLFVCVRGLRNDRQATGLLSKLAAWLPGNGSQSGNELARFLPYALLLLLVFSIVGTLLGIRTARRITGRLQRITAAAHAWSEGDFQVYVSDPALDELGQLTQDLNRMAQQIENLLATRQQLAQLEERQRVARDLHDSVKQQAFALTLLIGAAQSRLPGDPALAHGQLQRAGELADQIRQELTAILQQLRPVALIGQGLQAALRDCIRQWSQQTGMACEFQVSGLPAGSEAPALHPEIEEALFRVAQEALANVARHSQASQAQVRLEKGTDQVCLHVSDNGKGFITEQATGSGHGLANMHARVEAYGGALLIKSAPGETIVTGCIPLAQETHELRDHRERETA
jgi:signal transduction histidine kinase